MEDILLKMDSDKRERLINSALEEFGNNRFDKASTNTIVKNAGISKGLLYHYFKSKKSLYDYLVTFSIQSVVEAIMTEVGWKEPDLINRIKEISLAKLKIIERYPSMVVFSKSMYEGKSFEEIKDMIDQHAPDFYQQLYHKNIDFSFFKDDVDVQRAINIIQWTLEKLSEKYMEQVKMTNQKLDMKVIMLDIDKYLDLLTKAFYK